MEDQPVVILCTAPDAETAATLGRGLVQGRLAACVNVIAGIRSFYEWKGQMQDEAEVQLVIKTRQPLVTEVEKWLDREHPYEVPEFLVLEVSSAAPTYARWLGEQTTPAA